MSQSGECYPEVVPYIHTDHSPVSEGIKHETTLLDCQTPLMFYLRLNDIFFLHSSLLCRVALLNWSKT
jgi:hypothetical protein